MIKVKNGENNGNILVVYNFINYWSDTQYLQAARVFRGLGGDERRLDRLRHPHRGVGAGSDVRRVPRSVAVGAVEVE